MQKYSHNMQKYSKNNLIEYATKSNRKHHRFPFIPCVGRNLFTLLSKMLKFGLQGLTFGQALLGVQIKPGEGLDLAPPGTVHSKKV